MATGAWLIEVGIILTIFVTLPILGLAYAIKKRDRQ